MTTYLIARDELLALGTAGQSFRTLAPDEILADLVGLREHLAQRSVEISDESFEDQVRAYAAMRAAWRKPPPPPACYIEPRRRVAQWKTERRGRRS